MPNNTAFSTMLKMGMLAALLMAFAAGVYAQHDEHHPAQGNQPPTASAPTSSPSQPGMPGGMMGGEMMPMMMNMMMEHMGRMMAQDEQLHDTMTKMMQSLTAIENEKDPARLKEKMAEHRALMEQMRGQMMPQGGMMKMMMCGMNPAANPAPPAGK